MFQRVPVVVPLTLLLAACATEALVPCADLPIEVCASTAGCTLFEAFDVAVDAPTGFTCWTADLGPVSCGAVFDDTRCEPVATFAMPPGGGDCRWFPSSCVPERWEACETLPTTSTCPFCVEGELPPLQAPEVVHLGAARSPVSGDVDGDGELDLLWGDDEGVALLLGPVRDGTAPLRFATGDRDTDAELVAAVGDVTGDGVADLVLASASAERATATERRGAVWVLEGPIAAAPDDLDDAAWARMEGARVGDELGAAVHLDDVDGDGALDLLVWASDASDFARDGGRVDLHLGPLPAGAINSEAASARLSGAGDWGQAVVVADLDEDGVAELLVGTTGRSVVVFPSPVEGELVEADGVRLDARILGGTSPAARALGVGDLTGDGVVDLAFGVPEASLTGRARGEIVVSFGPIAVVPGTLSEDLVVDGACDGDQTGTVLALGDLDGDGALDLLAGNNARGGGALAGARFAGPLQAGALTLKGAAERLGVGGWSGGALVADLDADGGDDLVVADPEGGELRVWFGQP